MADCYLTRDGHINVTGQSWTGFYLAGHSFHGPNGDCGFHLDGSHIHGPNGDTGCYLDDAGIFGELENLPWMK